jgi:hypothetical protein
MPNGEGAKTNFDLVSSYMGWGDPNGNGLWFIGLEEGSYDYKSTESIREGFDECTQEGPIFYTPDGQRLTGKPDARYSDWAGPIPSWVAKISVSVSRCYEGRRDAWRDYRQNQLWTPGSRVFNSNLYTLPKISVAAKPEQYEKMFGISESAYADYYETGCSKRHTMLYEFRKSKCPGATICFGKSAWPKFESVLKLDLSCALSSNDNQIRVIDQPDARVILIPFMSRWWMRNAYVDRIAAQLRSWNVTIT